MRDPNELVEVPKIDLRKEERWFWICVAGLLAFLLIMRESTRPEAVRADARDAAWARDTAAIAHRVEALEKRADEQARIRCLNVTTDRMDMAIFPVENLGRKEVKP